MKEVFKVLLLLFLLASAEAWAQEVSVFGPKEYRKQDTSSGHYFEPFSAPSGEAVLRLTNGSGDAVVSYARVYLNGVEVVSSRDFNRRIPFFEIPVQLQAENTINLFLGGTASSVMTLEVRMDNPYPSASASALISPEEGGVLAVEDTDAVKGFRLRVPPGSVRESVIISVEIEDKQDDDPRLMPTITFHPSGLSFSEPAILEFEIPEFPEWVYPDLENAKLGLVDPEAGIVREELPLSISEDGERLLGEIHHFSKYDAATTRLVDVNKKLGLTGWKISDRRQVVFIHGLQSQKLFRGYGSYETFGDAPGSIAYRGYQVWSFEYDSFRKINQTAKSFKNQIKKVRDESDGANIALVGHSMGGLVARTYIRDGFVEEVDRLLMLGTPNHGADIAKFRDILPDKTPVANDLSESSIFWLGLSAWDWEVPANFLVWNVYDRNGDRVVSEESARLPFNTPARVRNLVTEGYVHSAPLLGKRIAYMEDIDEHRPYRILHTFLSYAAPHLEHFAGGEYHSVFLQEDGRLWSAGLDACGALGDGGGEDGEECDTRSGSKIETDPVRVEASFHAVQIATDKVDGSYAIDDAGGVWYWGGIVDIRRMVKKKFTKPRTDPHLRDMEAADIATTSPGYLLILNKDNELWLWSYGYEPQYLRSEVSEIDGNYIIDEEGRLYQLDFLNHDLTHYKFEKVMDDVVLATRTAHGGQGSILDARGQLYRQWDPRLDAERIDSGCWLDASSNVFGVYALAEDGSVWDAGKQTACGGKNHWDLESAHWGIHGGPYVDVTVGLQDQVFLMEDGGNFWSWGQNPRGSLGVGTSDLEVCIARPVNLPAPD